MIRRPPRSTLFPYTTALPIYRGEQRDLADGADGEDGHEPVEPEAGASLPQAAADEHHEGCVRRRVEGDVERVAERRVRSEEHTSELQSRQYLVCRLLLEKKTK